MISDEDMDMFFTFVSVLVRDVRIRPRLNLELCFHGIHFNVKMVHILALFSNSFESPNHLSHFTLCFSQIDCFLGA